MPPAGAFKPTGQYGRLVFTVNLPKEEEVDWSDYDIKALRVELNPTYFVCGRETGKEGRKHFQGYMEFEKKKTGSVIDKVFRKRFPLPISCHYEAAMGSAAQNLEYCSKEDKEAYVYGEPRAGQGARNDLQSIFQDIKNGKTQREIAEENPAAFCQYGRAFEAYRGMVDEKRSWVTQLIFLWGPTGTGKTLHSQELNPVTVNWVSNQFLNGFHAGDKTLLFDDFDYKKMDWQTFLTMTDRYAMSINVKGGSVNFAPKTIIFTSNTDPLDWWPDVHHMTREAIHRRMKEYGVIKYLGTLIPKHQNILTEFLIKKPSPALTTPQQRQEPEGAAAAAAGGKRSTPEIIDLTSDEDAPPLQRRGASAGAAPKKKTKGGNESSDEEHSDHSMVKRIKYRTSWDSESETNAVLEDTEEDEML